MTRDYSNLVNTASELENYGGYLTAEEEKDQAKARQAFVSARDSFVYAALKTSDDPESLKESIATDLNELRELQPGWASVFDNVEQEVFQRIDKESRKSPLRRGIVKWTPAALGVIAVVAYLGIRFSSGVEITQPLETKVGLQQRAEATEKVLRYDDFMGTNVRRGGFLKGILFWPIEPTEKEVAGASEFISVAFEGYGLLLQEQQICGTLSESANGLSKDQIEFASYMAEFVQRPNQQWQTPPVMTLLEPIKSKFKC